MGVRITTLLVKFALTLFIAKFLTLEDLGWFGLVSSAGIAAAPILGLGCIQTLSRTAVRADSKDLVAPINHYLTYVICLYSVLLGALLLSGLAHPLLVLLIWAVVLMEHLGNESYQLLVSRAIPLRANLLYFFRGGLWGLIYMPLAYAMPELRNLETLFLFWLVGGVVAFMGAFLAIRKWPWHQARLNLREGILWTIRETRAARALYISGVCETLSMHSDRFIVTALLGPETTGIYVFFLQIGTALANLHYSGVVQMSRPAFVRTAAESPPRLLHLFWKTSRIAFLSTALFSVVALAGIDYFLSLVNKQALSEWTVLFYFVLISFNLNVFAELQKMAMYALHADRAIMRLTVIKFVIAIALLASFIALFGLIGAGISLVCIATIRVLIQFLWLNTDKNIPAKDV